MPRLSLWNSGRKGADYNFIDRQVSEWFGVSGTAVYVHLYLGPHDQGDPATADQRAAPTVTSVQDVVFLENRDRRYSDDVFELRGVYNVNDVDFDLRQFGMFFSNDNLFIEFHLNDALAQIGRKLMSGDVVELPHLRDDALLDPTSPAVNKFYVIEDVNRASDGYSATWWPHVLRIRCTPMTAGQEYTDILEKNAKDPFGRNQGLIGDLMSTIGTELGLNEAVIDEAKLSVSGRNFETRQFYVVPGDELTGQNPWVFAGDGDPPNGAVLTGTGNRFPQSPSEGDYYLRNDYEPQALFRYTSGRWRLQELDYRQADWSVAHRLLEKFINNAATVTMQDGTIITERQSLFKAVKPRADF